MSIRQDINANARDIVRTLRKSKNLSQLELAQKVGITQSAMSKLENGERILSSDMIQQFAEVFNVPVAVIIGEEALPQDILCLRQFSSDLTEVVEGLYRNDEYLQEINSVISKMCGLIFIQNEMIEAQHKAMVEQQKEIESISRELASHGELLIDIRESNLRIQREYSDASNMVARVQKYLDSMG